MTFRILGPDGSDGAQWQALYDRLPPTLRDLHYLPGYGRVYRDTYGHEPFLAVLEEDDGCLLQAFVRRSLDDLPFLAQAGEPTRYHDVATPYGFGGPLPSDPGVADLPERLRRFDRELVAYFRGAGIPAEFTCLHPLLGNHRWVESAAVVPVAAEKSVVVVDLCRPEEAIWRAVARGTRSSINHARRSGVVVERVEPGERELAAFQGLYVETMRRRDAAARWFFPESYFPACLRRLGPERSALFFARCEGELAAAYLLLNDEQTAYYHFGASSAAWLERRPNNLLMYETILWAKARGLTRYHLGGGVTAAGDDSLLRFKSSFGGDRAVLYTYGRVHDDGIYGRLCELKLAHERRVHGAPLDRDYFPLYRR